MTDTFDELRIIAKDAKGLSPMDRAVIVHAADLLEMTQGALVQTQAALIEAQQLRMALHERLIHQQSMATGSMKLLNVTLPLPW